MEVESVEMHGHAGNEALLEHRAWLGRVLEHVALGLKPVVVHLRRMIRKERIVA